MCFSAEASFGAAALLSSVGVIAIVKTKRSPYIWIAMIPVLFGVQQLLEGFVWLATSHEEYSEMLKFSTYGFILFAWVIWPVYIPFALWKIEKNLIRKKAMLVLMILGTCIVSILIFVIVRYGVGAKIEDCSISYTYGINYAPGSFFSILYLMTTAVPNLISSTGKIWMLGIINLATYFVSKIYFSAHVISVWCFLAAISSVLILIIIMDLNKRAKMDLVKE